jgi:carboxypeptidase Q
MARILTAVFVCVLSTFALAQMPQAPQAPWLDQYRGVAKQIITESQSSDFAWRRLAELTDTYGNRLSGSDSLGRAIDWAAAAMRKDELENVRKEPVMVPKWVRGRESLELTAPVRQPLVMLGLGLSIGTPPDGIEADVVVLKSFDELDHRAGDVKDHVVLFNVPFTSYGETVVYRREGPSRVAKAGGVAMLLRSVGPTGLRTPHTGSLDYAAGMPKIPAAAIPAEDADRLQRLSDRGVTIRVKLSMEAHMDPDAPSANVVAEITGRELPNEVVVLGGHIDSWDVGAGASDDGGGCIVTWEALRLMQKLGLKPRRTVRVVLFTNEEDGAKGGAGYHDAHVKELPNHVLFMESDGGVFNPTGFGFTGPALARRTVTAIASLLDSLGASQILAAGEGTDIAAAAGTGSTIPMMSHVATGGGDYFLIHHTPADTIARITPKQMSDNAAVIAVMAYVVADLPFRLGAEK